MKATYFSCTSQLFIQNYLPQTLLSYICKSAIHFKNCSTRELLSKLTTKRVLPNLGYFNEEQIVCLTNLGAIGECLKNSNPQTQFKSTLKLNYLYLP